MSELIYRAHVAFRDLDERNPMAAFTIFLAVLAAAALIVGLVEGSAA